MIDKINNLMKYATKSKNPLDNKTYMFVSGGHDNRSTSALGTGLRYDISKGAWSSSDVPEMQDARKDHACLYIELETTRGVLVTGGKIYQISQTLLPRTNTN